MSQYVLVTRYQPDGRKRGVVHAWGPYESRNEASKVQRRFNRQHRDRIPFSGGSLTFHTLEIMSSDDDLVPSPEDWNQESA